jgi:hypothetical protein
MNNPVRAAHQHHREAAWIRRLAAGALTGQHVLEVGCGRGVGAEIILDRLGAAAGIAFDLDESMVELARRQEMRASCGPVVWCYSRRSHATLLDSWAFRTFTVHPRESRFEAFEFAAELARHGLHGTGWIERHLCGMVFVGAARKS